MSTRPVEFFIAIGNSDTGKTHVALGLGLAPSQRGSDQRHHLVAGVRPPGGIALHLGLSQLVQQRLDLSDAPGLANTGDKIMSW